MVMVLFDHKIIIVSQIIPTLLSNSLDVLGLNISRPEVCGVADIMQRADAVFPVY